MWGLLRVLANFLRVATSELLGVTVALGGSHPRRVNVPPGNRQLACMHMSEPFVERPSLRQAKRRTNHAAIRLAELSTAVAELQRVNAGAHVKVFVTEAELASGAVRPTIDWSEGTELVNREHVEHLCSEVIHHLRVALDYLAFQVCWLDSGERQDQTQFPICDSPAQWKREKRSRLPGTTIEHREAIGKLQPANGCSWTKRLRELSNPDKHRYISDISRSHSGRFNVDAASYAPDPNDPSRLVARFPMDTNVTFSDGEEVVSVLTELVGDVADTLVAFQGWFGEGDVLTTSLPWP
jgi:hypothetical protein